jgi:hypothetical protein
MKKCRLAPKIGFLKVEPYRLREKVAGKGNVERRAV